MMLTLLAAVLLMAEPDTLAPASVTAGRVISPPTEQVAGERLTGAPNAADVIRDFSGIQLRDYGGAGGLKTVNVRSLGSAHTAIFLDGIPIDNAQNMQVDLGRIDPVTLEGIELYSGQKSDLVQTAREYGSASALHLRSALPRKRCFRFGLRGGAFGTVAPSALAETRRGALAARLFAGADFSSGRYPFHDRGPGYDTLMMRSNSDLRAFRVQGQFWYLPAGGRYELQARFYDSERGIPGPVYKQAGGYPMSADRQADRTFTVQGGGEQRLGPAWKLLVRGKYTRDRLTYLDVSELNPQVSATWDYLLQTGYLSASLGWQPLPWLHLNAAADGQYDALHARTDARRGTLFGALSGAFLLDPWRVSASLQYQTTSDGYRFLSPSLLVNWHPRADWTFGGLVKRSCRLPSFNDLYYTNAPARNLRPECVWQFAARWCWDRNFGPWHFRAREELYVNLVQDKLIAVPNGSLFRWSMYNIGRVQIYGDELSAEARYSGRDWHAGITARYVYQRAFDPADGWQIPYIPRHSASFNLEGGWRTFGIAVRGYVSGTRYTVASARPEARLAPWTTWDASLSWQPLPLLRVSVDVRNLLNEQYQIVQQYPMPGLHVLGQLAIAF